jgi:hypothetical protein
VFRLDKVLEWKERLEEEARAGRLEVEARAAALARAADRLRAERHAFPDAPPGGDVVEGLRAWARRAELLRRSERLTRDRLAAMSEEIAAKRAAHWAIRREVESLRRLRERTLREERRRRERKMQEVIDDAAGRRFLPGPGRKFPDRHPHAESRETPAHGARPDGSPFSSPTR